MPLPMLIDFPKSSGDIETGMLEWSHHHRYDHQDIATAIQAQYGISVPIYVIDPMVFSNDSRFMLWNQQMHNDMNSVLGLDGSDISALDFHDASQVNAWLWNHFMEHRSAHEALGI